jgi:hypothetical protein
MLRVVIVVRRAVNAARNRRLFAGSLGALGATLILVMIPSSERDPELTYGASRVDGVPGIAIHWVLCADEASRVVDLEGYWGGSQPPTTVPVFWQVRNESPHPGRTRVETYVVGQVPAGFYQTVPLRRDISSDLVAIAGPPGDDLAGGGMTFRLAELRRDGIIRGDYEFVTAAEFASQGAGHCAHRPDPGIQGLGLLVLGLGGVLFVGRRHPTVSSIAVIGAGIGVMMAVGGWLRSPILLAISGSQQDSSSFAAGHAPIPPDRDDVLLIMSSATGQPHPTDGLYVGRILAPQEYAFVVRCDGPSIQIGEASEIPNGVTGSRQLIGCATSELVRGALSAKVDRSELVDIVVDANGMEEWSVVVIGGAGNAGPFIED